MSRSAFEVPISSSPIGESDEVVTHADAITLLIGELHGWCWLGVSILTCVIASCWPRV